MPSVDACIDRVLTLHLTRNHETIVSFSAQMSQKRASFAAIDACLAIIAQGFTGMDGETC
jgi:hypothetical protein